jgi:hypothetical protein
VDWYSVAKDFAGPGATVVAALSAVAVTAYFSWQQAKTARRQATTAKDQLRLNLFDKRYAVYKDIERHLGSLVDTPTPPLVSELFVAFDEAAFFFSPATCEWLKTVRDDCQAFLEARAGQREGTGDSRQKADTEIKIVAHFRAMPERFHDDLSFSQPTSD